MVTLGRVHVIFVVHAHILRRRQKRHESVEEIGAKKKSAINAENPK